MTFYWKKLINHSFNGDAKRRVSLHSTTFADKGTDLNSVC